jgi:tetrahydromethanopterin S-methyltransferase subunit G
MNPATFQPPFVQTAMPIMFTILIVVWVNNKAFDDIHKRLDGLKSDMNRRLDEVNARLTRIERKLDNHEERIVRVEERTSVIRR